MRYLPILLCCLLPACTASRKAMPATEAQAQQSVTEAAMGYAVSFIVINELMGVIDASHVFYREEGHWPLDSSALMELVGTQTEIDSGKYQRLSIGQVGADHLTVNFRLAPHTVQLDEQVGSPPVDLLSVAGRIGIDPFGPDSANVHVDLDELRFASGKNPPLTGDMSGAAMDFKVGRPE